jgi:small subunit ribosomal protein S1
MTDTHIPETETAVETLSEPAQAPVTEPEPDPAPEPPAKEPPSEEPPAEEPPSQPNPPAIDDPPATPDPVPIDEPPAAPPEPQESFADLLKEFERSHSHRAESKQLQGVVVSVSAEQVFLDIGYKTEGVLPRSAFENNAEGVKPGDTVPVSVTGRNEEHYYVLSRFRVALPRDWSALEQAFAEKTAVAGTVTEVVKGGLSVDVGVRAFMPASRSGTRDAAELEALVGTEITCRITKLDVTDENVVVDRRVVLEEQARGALNERRAALKEGDTVSGTVRTLMPYGAFVTIGGAEFGGLDGLLHVSDISLARVSKPEDVLTVGQELTLRILKIDPETQKISLGLKQLQPEPWETAPQRLLAGQRVSGTVTRIMDFGAFVEIEPGLEGLIHVSEMSWAKKVRHPSDLLKPGDRVDAVILSVKPEEKRIALGLKQALADPWLEVRQKFPENSQIEGPVTKIMNFGAFVEVAEGVEGLVHISEIVADRRLNHPSDVLRVGQRVQALVLAIDTEKRQIKLSMKQLIPTSIDEYIAEHKVGDKVSGRVVQVSSSGAQVDLGDGIRGICGAGSGRGGGSSATAETKPAGKADLSQLSSMLKARWKGNGPAEADKAEPLAEGQIRTFRITKLEAESKKIEVVLIEG